MYQAVIAIQCISIIVLLVECCVIFREWKGMLHAYLFLSCVATLVNNVGYLMELLARTQEAYFTAVKISYLGRVMIAFSLVMFVTELTGFKLPRWGKYILIAINIATFVVVATTKSTGLYYREMGFHMEGNFPVFERVNGPWHLLWDVMLLIYVISGMSILFSSYFKEKNASKRKRLFMVMLAMTTISFSVLLELFRVIPGTELYDETMLGFALASIFMFIAIVRYNLLDTETLAREYVIDELSEGIIAIDENGEVNYFNKPAKVLFPELEKNPDAVKKILQDAVDAGEPINIADRIYTTEANTLYQNGAAAGTLFAITDDTDHYRYMAELEEQKKLADSANKAKSSFLANMSHEIRTPINAVLGMDEMILRESGEKEIRAYAADIQTAGRTLLSLINDILDLSKIEEGRMEILPTQYELSSVISDLYNMIRVRAEEKRLKLNINVDSNVPHILYGDEIRIKQIVLNLLTNAVKYTDSGEIRLDISFSGVSEDEILLKCRVSDTGIGLKEEEIDKLCAPFFRLDEERNRGIEGTGLGLSIVRQLLSLMDSKLNIKSSYGEGSEFSFDIIQKVISWDPMGDVTERFENEPGEKDAYRELFMAPEASILVVDDTEVNLTVMKNLLKKTKIEIDTAISGQQAVAMAKDKHYDVVFIDHMMPGMDGIETLHKMKEQDDEDDTVYIALTANAVSGAREMYLREGFTDYVSKPVDGLRLEQMLLRYIHKEKILEPEAAPEKRHNAIRRGKQRILVVDDDEVICTAASLILGDNFEVTTCQDGNRAVDLALEKMPALILLDINLVGINGFQVLENLKKEERTCDIPVMFITAEEDREMEVQGLKSGAQDFIRKPFVPEVLLQRSKRTIALDRYQKDLQGEVRRQTARAERLTKDMMLALSHTVDAKDHYTKGHSERVALYSAEIARRLGKSPEDQKKLYEIGLLHDIGKIGVSEDIINKTERLTDEEFGQIQKHTVIGNEILKGISDLPELCLGARSHHERFDGSGYPDGLSGEDIPEVARIICVADCYDAMTSTRTYSKPKAQAQVREEIVRCSGKQFDPRIAGIMLSMIDDDKDYVMNESAGAPGIWKGKEALWDKETDDGYEDELPVHDDSMEKEEQESDTGPDKERIFEILEGLKNIPELDVAQGIANCGSEDSLISVVEVFHQTAPQKTKEIEDLFENSDIENYTIKVHALKSSARIIGAMELSGMAKDLEDAGKAGNTDMIREKTGELLSRYREIDSKLSLLDKEADELLELTPAMRKDAFQTIGEIAGAMDYGMMEKMVRDLKKYRLSDEEKETLSRIEERMLELDWDGISEIIKMRNSD
ncbi:MAG: response regulator [Butyrivibrio sp.]|nr:response regulator [Butyrivibrio sp.]